MSVKKTDIKTERPGMVPVPGRPRPEGKSEPAPVSNAKRQG